MNYTGELMLSEDGFQKTEIGNISFDEGIIWRIFYILQVLCIASVGQGVEIENVIRRVFLDQ